ncbi:taurine ABC transporter substrate-binding protein [soil metagenome]
MRKFARLGGVVGAVGIVAMALVGCSSGGATDPTNTGAPKLFNMTVSVGGNSNDIALQYAITQGYFAAEGLAVQATVLQNGAQLMPLLLNGQMQAGLSNVPNVAAAVTKGLDVKFVASAVYNAKSDKSFDGIIVGADSGIKSPKDLVGKTVAVPGVSGASALLLFAAVTKDGGDPNGIKMVEMAQPDMVAAVQSGHVDAGVEVEPFVTVGTQAGLKVLVYPSSYALPGQLFTGWVMSTDFIKQHPDQVAAFQRALNKANSEIGADIAADGKVARTVLANSVKIDPAVIGLITMPTFSGDELAPAAIADVLADVYKFKLLAGSPLDAKTLIWSGK